MDVLAMSIFVFLTKFLVIWHPWHPWVCIRSDLKPVFETDLSDSSYCEGDLLIVFGFVSTLQKHFPLSRLLITFFDPHCLLQAIHYLKDKNKPNVIPLSPSSPVEVETAAGPSITFVPLFFSCRQPLWYTHSTTIVKSYMESIARFTIFHTVRGLDHLFLLRRIVV